MTRASRPRSDVVSAEYQKELPKSVRLFVSNDNEELRLWKYCSEEEFQEKYSEEALSKGRKKIITYHPGSREIVTIIAY